MKNLYLIGVSIIIALVVLNTQLFTKSNNSNFTLSFFITQAFADGESGGQECYTFYPHQWWGLSECENGNSEGIAGGTAACSYGTYGHCEEGDWYYKYSCDGTAVGYGPYDKDC